MVLYEIYSHPKLFRYYTTIFSRASIVQLICITATIVCPFLIAYYAGGFWIYEKTVTEQPNVKFKYRYIALLESDSQIYLSSSYDNVNEIYSDYYRPTELNVQELDTNEDNYKNLLNFDLFISGIPPSEIIRNAKVILLFQVELDSKARVRAETMAYVETTNSRLASDISFSGELQFFQTERLRENSDYLDYNYQLLNQTSIVLEDIDLNNIVHQFVSRRYGTKLSTDYVSWSSKRVNGFKIKGQIRYPPFHIIYIPWFWEQIKTGFIHYLACLTPILFIFRLTKTFIFSNQLVPTITMSSNLDKKTN